MFSPFCYVHIALRFSLVRYILATLRFSPIRCKEGHTVQSSPRSSLYMQTLSLVGNTQASGELRHLYMKIFASHTLSVNFFVVRAIVGLESTNFEPYASE